MKYLIFTAALFCSLLSYAQTVNSIKNNQAMVTLDGNEGLQKGTAVQFLNHDLEVVGHGEVTKISNGGKKALIKIQAGKVQPGMTLEKVPAPNQVDSAAATSAPAPSISYAALSDKDKDILARGEITRTRYVVGGILGTYPLGLGIGHAVQGRYTEKGWIFTVGELASIAALAAGLGNCTWSSYDNDNCENSGGLIFLGLFGYVGFRIWEIIDVWAAPPEHNRRYHQLKSMYPGSEITFQPGFIPMAGGGGLGFQMTF